MSAISPWPGLGKELRDHTWDDELPPNPGRQTMKGVASFDRFFLSGSFISLVLNRDVRTATFTVLHQLPKGAFLIKQTKNTLKCKYKTRCEGQCYMTMINAWKENGTKLLVHSHRSRGLETEVKNGRSSVACMSQINTNHVPMAASCSSTDPVSPCSAQSIDDPFCQILPKFTFWKVMIFFASRTMHMHKWQIILFANRMHWKGEQL